MSVRPSWGSIDSRAWTMGIPTVAFPQALESKSKTSTLFRYRSNRLGRRWVVMIGRIAQTLSFCYTHYVCFWGHTQSCQLYDGILRASWVTLMTRDPTHQQQHEIHLGETTWCGRKDRGSGRNTHVNYWCQRRCCRESVGLDSNLILVMGPEVRLGTGEYEAFGQTFLSETHERRGWSYLRYNYIPSQVGARNLNGLHHIKWRH